MKRISTTFTVLALICFLVTPVLAGKGGGSGSQYKYGGGSSLGGSSMSQNQQQNQYQYKYQYEKKQSADSSARQTHNQIKTRDPLTHTIATPATTDSQSDPQ
ncbi:MAG: hypothetical protein L3J57_05185 [Desulfuromusa sp.]|nr:hypothetical protein [Desulfuromusa sp.]